MNHVGSIHPQFPIVGNHVELHLHQVQMGLPLSVQLTRNLLNFVEFLRPLQVIVDDLLSLFSVEFLQGSDP